MVENVIHFFFNLWYKIKFFTEEVISAHFIDQPVLNLI
jgi:hypothetical protein